MKLEFTRVLNHSNTNGIFQRLQNAEISCGRAIELLNPILEQELSAKAAPFNAELSALKAHLVECEKVLEMAEKRGAALRLAVEALEKYEAMTNEDLENLPLEEFKQPARAALEKINKVTGER
jgi:hypothetical protein